MTYVQVTVILAVSYNTCSKESFLRIEWLSTLDRKQIVKAISKKEDEIAPIATGNEKQNNNLKNHLLILPYKGSDVIHIFFIWNIKITIKQ